MLLTARDPRLKSIRDFGPDDRIAVPAVKVSAQAVIRLKNPPGSWKDLFWPEIHGMDGS